MECGRPQSEQTKSEPVVGDARKGRATGGAVSRWPLILNDAHSPILKLGHRDGPSRTSLPHPLQAKLTVNEPGDQYEQEADRIAEQVMRMRDPTIRLQRKCICGGTEECAECATNKALQRHAANEAATEAPIPSIVNEVLSSPGQVLDNATRAFMEARFQADFGDVKIHADTRAAESARAVNALAYTVGHEVVFGQSQYAPTKESGRRLLAHELTHVIQQNSADHISQPAGLIQRQEVCTGGVYDEVNQVCRPFEESDRTPRVPESHSIDAEFFTRPPRLRAGAQPIFDPEVTGAIIGYRYSSSGYYEVYDLEGNIIEVGEEALEAPLIDPIDVLAGGIAGIGRGILGGGARGAARGIMGGAAGGGGSAGWRALAGALSRRAATAIRAAYRAIRFRGALNFTATTARHMGEAGRRVPIHILQLALRYGTRTPDPQGAAGAFRYVIQMSRGVVERGTGRWVYREYTLEVVIREADRTILHFLYR